MNRHPTKTSQWAAFLRFWGGWSCWMWAVLLCLLGQARGQAASLSAAQLARAASTTLVITPARPLTLCRGSFTQIQASVPADFTPNWYWTKDGVKFSQDRDMSITVNEPGTYTLGGEWETDPTVTVNGVFTLTIIDLPVTAVNASATSVCAGQSFTLAAELSSSTNQYQWVDSQHRFIVAGPVLATNSPDAYSLVVVSPSACTYVATAPLVTAYASQTITLQADGPMAFCEGGSVRLVQGGGDLINPVWIRNGQALTAPFSATLTVADEGIYNVRGDGAGCIQFPPPLSVTVGTRPTAQLVASQSVVCRGNTYELAVQPADPANGYVWLNQAGKVVNSFNVPRLTVADETPYRLRISTPTGCTLLISSDGLVQFIPQTTLHIAPAGSLSICQDKSTTLTVSGGDVSGYVWTRNGMPIPGSDGLASLPVNQAGVYALDGAFPTCVNAPDKPVIAVTPPPAVSLVAGSLTLCAGQQTTIVAQTDAANTLHWLRDGVEAGTAPRQTAGASTTFSLTVTTPAGCQQTAVYAFNPQLVSLPDFKLDQPEPVWQNTLVQPDNVPENPGYRYQWLPPAGVSDPTIARPLLNPAVATSYTLTITDQHGCQFSDRLTLTLFTQLLTPTAFSPNGDGQNDTWAPVNIDRYPNAELSIYDRWGTLVYAGRSGEAPFDGTLRGEPLPGGIYTYRIRLNIQQIESRGTLRLIR
ncbi:hypothetical protein FAES_0049 [Fibrella aestuarina BUZ 2]|uniref:Ig-like domain-containing protein n=1 Tax=Fibrella aestuarina BUZ 2 TaxID=1166018 RepID=I0K1R0_9BACT|nr:gliding motility-associated C-terminal domain-containing protein [Fibrella aestuarina]CCG98063.1 hypothetical protein FAES_0049 [Fibrella aestuarina BUZ 2]